MHKCVVTVECYNCTYSLMRDIDNSGSKLSHLSAERFFVRQVSFFNTSEDHTSL